MPNPTKKAAETYGIASSNPTPESNTLGNTCIDWSYTSWKVKVIYPVATRIIANALSVVTNFTVFLIIAPTSNPITTGIMMGTIQAYSTGTDKL